MGRCQGFVCQLVNCLHSSVQSKNPALITISVLLVIGIDYKILFSFITNQMEFKLVYYVIPVFLILILDIIRSNLLGKNWIFNLNSYMFSFLILLVIVLCLEYGYLTVIFSLGFTGLGFYI